MGLGVGGKEVETEKYRLRKFPFLFSPCQENASSGFSPVEGGGKKIIQFELCTP